MNTPQWLKDHIAENARRATLKTCPRCHAPVIVGLDADVAAFKATCDPTPLTPLGEYIALADGRITYDLAGGYSRKELWQRTALNIQTARRYPVLTEHRCGKPLAEYAEPNTDTEKERHSDEPPF